ncbi:MAG: hypothetical protein ACR2KZ_03875 [Segetibacter sp.]
MKVILQHAIRDRFMVIAGALFLLVNIIIQTIFAFQIQPSDLNVKIRYTAFGFTNYYDNAWYYLLSFIVFWIFVLIIHLLIAAKLYDQRGAYSARLFLLLSIVIVAVEYFIVSSILEVSLLSR